MSEEWYLETTYDEAKRIIRANLNTMSRSFIAVGFYLKHIRDNGLFQEDGYHDIWEFAADQYGIQRSTASRWMAMNDRFSVGGNSPVLLEEYRDFGKSQLQEMLYLPEEKLPEATPDMTVKEIRELRREEPGVEEGPEEEPVSIPEEEPVSILGYPLREYPEGSLLTVPGCGKQDCFSCHWDGCGLRQVDCYCVEAPMGKPFPCTILQDGTSILKEQVGNHCQFVNTDLASIRVGDGQPVPCCKKCIADCTYRCERSCKDLGIECATPHTEEPVCEDLVDTVEGELTEELYEEISDQSDADLLKEELDRAKSDLNLMLSCYSEKDIRVRKQKLLVGAMAGMLCDLDVLDIPESGQPELPKFRNNDQRKAWLRDYKSWGLWYEDENIGARYYKYDFNNGARLIAETYIHPGDKYAPEHESSFLHLVGGPEPTRKNGIPKWVRHERYDRFSNNETELVEFLKYVQKEEA